MVIHFREQSLMCFLIKKKQINTLQDRNKNHRCHYRRLLLNGRKYFRRMATGIWIQLSNINGCSTPADFFVYNLQTESNE